MTINIIINPQAFARAVVRQATPIVNDDLQMLRDNLKAGFDQPKSGRIYRRPSGGEYRASAPGESPARRTGALEESISEPRIREASGGLIGEIGIGKVYGRYLERGTGRIAPRPWVRPAIDAMLRAVSGR